MFTLRSGGCFSRHPVGCSFNRPQGIGNYLLLIIRSYAQITINGVEQTGKPGSTVLIPPHTPYSYHNPQGEYMDDWLGFSCDEKDLIHLDPALFCHVFPLSNLSLMTNYIQQLLWEKNYAPETYRDAHINIIFELILHHLTNDFHTMEKKPYNPYHVRLQQLHLDMQATPYKDFSIEKIAKDLDISISYFQHMYKDYFGISFRSDLIGMRIDYAKELITSTVMPLEQIAYSCGYSSEVHFYRQFLSKVGMTPGEYRKSYSFNN